MAAKCGVFAETDIVNLVKSGIPKDEVLNSLADAIVLQNLSVLTRGNTLKPRVLLLGGPNTYLPFLQDCWRLRIPETWRDRGLAVPTDMPVEDLIFVPQQSDLYAAYGAAMFGLADNDSGLRYRGAGGLESFIQNGRRARLGEQAGPPLSRTGEETRTFEDSYRIEKFVPPVLEAGTLLRGVIGLDGGSTSSKAVLVSEDGALIAKAYQLSKGNPILDTKELLANIKGQLDAQGVQFECVGLRSHGVRGGHPRRVRSRRRQRRRDGRPHDQRGALLRRRRRDLRHWRTGHQGLVHEERRHPELQAVQQL